MKDPEKRNRIISISTSTSAQWALSVTASVAVLGGCDGDRAQLPVGTVPIQRNATQLDLQRQRLLFGGGALGNVPPSIRTDRGRSWMSLNATHGDLLYISNAGNGDVFVYSYPKGVLKGVLSGFNYPGGLCVNATNSVWITHYGGPIGKPELLEYAHGATRPMAKLSDPGQKPEGCAIDPTSGNLAVTNFYQPPSGAGSVSIYKKARGVATNYTDPNIYFMFFCGYDSVGNLFVDGISTYGDFQFAELQKGSSTFTDISLDPSINAHYPAGVQWDGKYMAVGAQETRSIYQVSVSGSTGTIVSSTPLGESCDPMQFSIIGQTVIVPNYCDNDVGFYPYATGGGPKKTIVGNWDPVGSAMSRGTKR